ncbi:pseudouridine synthase [Roseateles asaccharophilus]|uniref:tRNA pseudouridine synthase C n=1 Tax=Roseateles asaccharophilus TaxID=582607 RepID=A0ABU2A2D4_9BURK|nr:pseudouridine synthase [Roseateles asaccharophilus]MDR7331352.1 tRNA pseudouridine65 synthase [Roseateles asaccharophilus]
MTLTVLHLDQHLVAIDKPPGLLVHRTQLAAGEDEAALQLLRDQLGRTVWPVHRLDRGTSGVLLFALSAEVASLLGAMFEQGLMDKRYLALVRGWPGEDQGLIDHPLARDPELPSAGQNMLDAQTRWRVLKRLEWPIATDPRFATTRVALLEAEPLQGRRHQIRRHLKHIAHPILGDATHGKGPLNRAVAAHLGVQRLWLHAEQLRLMHPVSGMALALQAAPGAGWP